MNLPKSPCIECKRRPCPKICYPKKDFDRAFLRAYRKKMTAALPRSGGGVDPMRPKADTRIGARACQEVFDRSGGRRGIKGVMEDLGLDRKAYWLWRDGTCAPNTTALQKMAVSGFDVVYILTGRRTQPRAEYIPEEDDYE